MSEEMLSQLDELDPETRAACEALAAERGVTLEEFLNDILLTTLICEPQEEGAHIEEEVAPPQASAPPVPFHEAQVTRQRLEALDRRLGVAASGFESALDAIDGSIATLTARADDQQLRDEQNDAQIEAALNELRGCVRVLEGRAETAQANVEALDTAQTAFRDQMAEDFSARDQRVDALETTAQTTRTELDHLRFSVSEGLQIVSAEANQRIATAQSQWRAALQAVDERAAEHGDKATRHAEAAAQRAVTEARACRDEIDQKLIEAAADTHQRIDQVLTRTAKLYDGLTDTIGASEDATAREAQALRAQTVALEAATHVEIARLERAIEDSHATLQVAAAQTANREHAIITALDTRLSDEIADVRERQLGGAARLKLIDVAITKSAHDIDGLRTAFGQRCDESDALHAAAIAATRDASATHADTLAAQLDAANTAIANLNEAFKADLSALSAALAAKTEHFAREHDATRDAVRNDLDELAALHRTATEQVRAQLDNDVTDLRAQHKGAIARLKLADEAIDARSQAIQNLDLRTQALTERFGRAEVDNTALGSILQEALAQVNERVSHLETQAATSGPALALTRVDDLVARVGAHESEASEAAERANNLARLVGKLSGQYMETATHIQERLHKLEVGVADARIERVTASDGHIKALTETITMIERRVIDLDRIFGARLNALDADIHETREIAATPQVANELDALRADIDERLATIERRSLQALEQLSATVAIIGKRAATKADEDTDDTRRTA